MKCIRSEEETDICLPAAYRMYIFKFYCFNPTEHAAGTFGTQLKWSEERWRTGDRNTRRRKELYSHVPDPIEQKAPHMFCPSQQDFYSRLSVINVLDSFCRTIQETVYSLK